MPLGDALRELAKRSGRNLIVDDALIAGKVAAPLAGRLSPEEGVRRLLAGTGLSSRTVDGTIIVSSGPVWPRSTVDVPSARFHQRTVESSLPVAA